MTQLVEIELAADGVDANGYAMLSKAAGTCGAPPKSNRDLNLFASFGPPPTPVHRSVQPCRATKASATASSIGRGTGATHASAPTAPVATASRQRA